MKIKAGVMGFTAFLGLSGSGVARATVVDAVEYYYSGHYFVTVFPDEIAAIDSGAAGGWVRTGYSFKVQNRPTGGYSPVCRFYLTGLARGSHFYTANAAECAGLKTDLYWKYEADAFYVSPVASDGSCSSGKIPVYRLYNNQLSGTPNHRYSTAAYVQTEMASKGWALEGAAFCAEAAAAVDPSLPQPAGKMVGGTWTFSYAQNGSQSTDVLTFTKVVSNPASTLSPDTAEGTNQYGLPVKAQYNTQTGKMAILSTFIMPATDYYSVSFDSDNALSGCYEFLPTNVTTPSGTCIAASGRRK
jgi:Repeat of unknown function (DUF5648)